MAHNPEVAGSNPAPATQARGPFSNRERAFCLRYVHERLLKPGSWLVLCCDVRVTDPLAERPRAAGFVIYQQLNHGPIERAHASRSGHRRRGGRLWGALKRAGEMEMFFTAILGFIMECRETPATFGGASAWSARRAGTPETG